MRRARLAAVFGAAFALGVFGVAGVPLIVAAAVLAWVATEVVR